MQAPYGKVALGIYYYTTKFDDLLETDSEDNPIQRKCNPGPYILAEQTVYHEKADPAQDLAIFGSVGFADSKVNQFRSYTGIGGVYTGLKPGQDQDQIGFAIAAAHNGGKFKQAQFDARMPVDNSEEALELTNQAQITPYFVYNRIYNI